MRGLQPGAGLNRVGLDAYSHDGNQRSQRRIAPWHPWGCIETGALEPERRRCSRTAGLDQFEVVTDMQGSLFDDPHDDSSRAASDPESTFNFKYNRQVIILHEHVLILPVSWAQVKDLHS
jgi:hypothetical protein